PYTTLFRSRIYANGAVPFAYDDVPESAHHRGCDIDAAPRLSPQSVSVPAHQYAPLPDDRHKHRKAKCRRYQSSCCHPDVFYAVRADALPAFSSVLPVIQLFSVLHAVQGSDVSRAVPDQTSL